MISEFKYVIICKVSYASKKSFVLSYVMVFPALIPNTDYNKGMN
jgi:hypothetical protein